MNKPSWLYIYLLSALAFVLCHKMALAYNGLDWQWWLLIALGAFAIQPYVNIILALVEKRWERRRKRAAVNYFALTEPDVSTHIDVGSHKC